MKNWLDKYKDGESTTTDVQFGNLHPEARFTPSKINLGKAGAISGRFNVPGKLGFATFPIIDATTGIMQLINEEKDIIKSTNPKLTREQLEYDNAQKRHLLLGTPPPKQIRPGYYQDGGYIYGEESVNPNAPLPESALRAIYEEYKNSPEWWAKASGRTEQVMAPHEYLMALPENAIGDVVIGGLGKVAGPIIKNTIGKAVSKVYNKIPSKKVPNFKSEIDWAKWNPDTPKHSELINEYNTIEETAKKSGSWMKNPDGSKFEGTPEQFIQQQSSHFKKAFPEGVDKTYRGDFKHFPELDYNPIFTGDEELARQYTKNNADYWTPFHEPGAIAKSNISNSGGLHELYYNPKRLKINIDAKNQDFIGKFTDPNTGRIFESTDDIARAIASSDKDAILTNIYDNSYHPGIVRIINHNLGSNNFMKSARGNVGFFDMTNPNIYKGLTPLAAGAGTAAYVNSNKPQQYQDGGYLGTTNKDFDYNGAWGGQFQQGGSIPGSVGFTYARTGSIPSEGSYGKKTIPSAQNGLSILPDDYNKFLQYSETAPENRRPDKDWTYGNPRQYNHYGMWEALGKPSNFNEALEKNPSWKPNEYDKMYHGYSTNPNTLVWLKPHIPGEKEKGSTAWMEAKSFYLSGDKDWNPNNFSLVYDPEIQRMRYVEKNNKLSYQNGGEMQHYQQGLDWNPRTISRNGTKLGDGGNMLPDRKERLMRQAFAESSWKEGNVLSPANALGPLQIREILYKDYVKATGDKTPYEKVTDFEHAMKVRNWKLDDALNAEYIKNRPNSPEVRLAKQYAEYNMGRSALIKHLNKAKSKGMDIYKKMDWVDTLPEEPRNYIGKVLLKNIPDFEEQYKQALKTNKNVEWFKNYKKGGVVQDDRGYWNPDNWGKPVQINSNNITMKGVNEPLMGISDTGDVKYMIPNQDYQFKGKSVVELPIAKYGINNLDEKTEEHLDNLTNFTNYNPSPKGWLDKYNK